MEEILVTDGLDVGLAEE